MTTSYVNLYVLHRHQTKVLELLQANDHPRAVISLAEEDDFTTWIGIEDVHGGELGIEDILVASKIPYSKQVEGTDDYAAYEEHFRVLPSGTGYRRMWDCGQEDTLKLHAVHEASMESLAAVQELVARHRENYAVMPWADQYEVYNNLFGEEEV